MKPFSGLFLSTVLTADASDVENMPRLATAHQTSGGGFPKTSQLNKAESVMETVMTEGWTDTVGGSGTD